MPEPIWLDILAAAAALAGGAGLVLVCIWQLRASGEIYPPGRARTLEQIANERAREARFRDIKERSAKIADRAREGGRNG